MHLPDDETPSRQLDADLREWARGCFGTSFEAVRLHDGPQANRFVQRLEAQACTAGTDIFFAEPFAADLGLLAHEMTHVLQYWRARGASDRSQRVPLRILSAASEAEAEADRAGREAASGLRVSPIVGRWEGLARTVTSGAVVNLLSYGAFDWEVTPAEERRVITLLAGDTSPVNTINDLRTAGMLEALIERVDGPEERLELMQVLGAKLDTANVDSLRSLTLILGDHDPYKPGFVLNISHDLQTRFRAMGLTTAAPAFNTAALSYVIGRTRTAPFGGSGATGLNPSTRPEIPMRHQAGMAAGIESVRQLYHNPVGDLGVYLSSLTPQMRRDQAELLLRQPVSSVVPYSYLGSVPSRADVIRAAARQYDLHGPAIAAFILAEQRDQSSNEDAKDYQAAVSVLAYNSSIGLGQVVVSTARRYNLFSDLLRASTMTNIFGGGLYDWQIALLLASDEFNIFAAAKYIRQTANAGATMLAARLPNTVAAWPGVDFAAYGRNSRTWPDDNIAALGSEYTSTPWDDRVTPWGDFVLAAYRDVVASGVF